MVPFPPTAVQQAPANQDSSSPLEEEQRYAAHRAGGEMDRAGLHLTPPTTPPRPDRNAVHPISSLTPAPASAVRRRSGRWTKEAPSSSAPSTPSRGSAPTTEPKRKKLFGFGRTESPSNLSPQDIKLRRSAFSLLGRRSSWVGSARGVSPMTSEPDSRHALTPQQLQEHRPVPISPPSTVPFPPLLPLNLPPPMPIAPPGQIKVEAIAMSARTGSWGSIGSSATVPSLAGSMGHGTDESLTSAPSASPNGTHSHSYASASPEPDREGHDGCEPSQLPPRTPSPASPHGGGKWDSTPEGTVVASPDATIQGDAPLALTILSSPSSHLLSLRFQDDHFDALPDGKSTGQVLVLPSAPSAKASPGTPSNAFPSPIPSDQQPVPSNNSGLEPESEQHLDAPPRPDTTPLLSVSPSHISKDGSHSPGSESFVSAHSGDLSDHSPELPMTSPSMANRPSPLRTTIAPSTLSEITPVSLPAQYPSPAVPANSPVPRTSADSLMPRSTSGTSVSPPMGRAGSTPPRPVRSPARVQGRPRPRPDGVVPVGRTPSEPASVGKHNGDVVINPAGRLGLQNAEPHVHTSSNASSEHPWVPSQDVARWDRPKNPSATTTSALAASEGELGFVEEGKVDQTPLASRMHSQVGSPLSPKSETQFVPLTAPAPVPNQKPGATSAGLAPTNHLLRLDSVTPTAHFTSETPILLPRSENNIVSFPTPAPEPSIAPPIAPTEASQNPPTAASALKTTTTATIPGDAFKRTKQPDPTSPGTPSLEVRQQRIEKVPSVFAPGVTPTRDNALPAMAWGTIASALPKFQSATVEGAATFERGKVLRMVLQPFLNMKQSRPLVRPDAPSSTPDSHSTLSTPIGSSVHLDSLSPSSPLPSTPLTPPSVRATSISGSASPSHSAHFRMSEATYDWYKHAHNRRALLYDWIFELLRAIKTAQGSSDRLAILESMGMLLEARNLSADAFDVPGTPACEAEQYQDTLFQCLYYALNELNKKGVYHNNLIFAGRILSIALFRTPGVGEKLLGALPLGRTSLERVANEAQWPTLVPLKHGWDSYLDCFPSHLRTFCFRDARSYLERVNARPAPQVPDEPVDDTKSQPDYLVGRHEHKIQMSGNWLRRWQSDDSEAVFSFFRHFHRQLDRLLQTNLSQSAHHLFFGAPAFAHIAASIHQKCLALVHRSINSVTTQQSQADFNPGETANVLLGSSNGKPKNLDSASARCVSAVVESVTYGELRPIGSNTRPSYMFLPSIQLHLACLVKRTSLYDVQGVFCLWDWIDGLLEQAAGMGLPIGQVVNIDFIVGVIRQILLDADHAVALMRTLAFCYSKFGLLMSTTGTREHLADCTLLSPPIFTKLFLSWSHTIRAYFLNTLVFRFGHISDFAPPCDDPQNVSATRVANLLHTRLNHLRAQYEALIHKPDRDSEHDSTNSSRSPSIYSTIRTIVAPTNGSSPAHTESDTDAWHSSDSLLSPVGTPSGTPSGTHSHSPQTPAKAQRILGIHPSPVTGPEPSKRSWFRNLGKRNKVSSKSHARQQSGGGSLAARRESRTGSSSASSSELNLSTNPAFRSSNGKEERRGRCGSVATREHLAPNATFDLQSERLLPTASRSMPNLPLTAPSFRPSIAGRKAQPPRVSRDFAHRSSLVPGPAADLVHALNELSPSRSSAASTRPSDVHPIPRSLQPYAIHSMREYEQTIKEHDEFMAGRPPEEKSDVPSLTVAWPAMWQGE